MRCIGLGKFLHRTDPEGTQELLGRTEQKRPSRHLFPAHLLDEIKGNQTVDGKVAVDSTDILHFHSGHRLTEGDYGQGLQKCGRELGLFGLCSDPDQILVQLRLGGQLNGFLVPVQ